MQGLLPTRQPLEPLPYPVYFVRYDPELCTRLAHVTEMPAFEEFYNHQRGASSSWIVQTYLQLKCRGLDVRLVPSYVPGGICIVAREELRDSRLFIDLPFKSYLVVCQQDRPRPEVCEQRVVQNPLNILDDQDHFIPHWAQPDIRPRNLSRGARVENLVFKGRWYYLPEPFKSSEFIARLNSLGFNLRTYADHEVDCNDWGDYTEADVVLAIRNSPQAYLSLKPASKLVNAWFAGCPALLGAEPAFQMLRQSELDYIEIATPDNVVNALKQLRDQPNRYQAMVENGWQRTDEFAPDKISQLWRDLLAGAIAEGYERWLDQPFIWKSVGRPLQFVVRSIKHLHTSRRFYAEMTWD
ncbi:MAG: glycosyltransferase family 1 protein [Leptolyngbyaceae cyanobacterium RU_5_1]|nr:glycosyltransferase family 1 protein [Leptolyngbyaceae cyanobacterium RU_5_1]